MAKGLAVTKENWIPDFVCVNSFAGFNPLQGRERKPAYEKIESHRKW
jgi:hypothetical protein